MAAPLDIYAFIDYISAKTRSSALMKAYLWSTNDDNDSYGLLTMTMIVVVY